MAATGGSRRDHASPRFIERTECRKDETVGSEAEEHGRPELGQPYRNPDRSLEVPEDVHVVHEWCNLQPPCWSRRKVRHAPGPGSSSTTSSHTSHSEEARA